MKKKLLTIFLILLIAELSLRATIFLYYFYYTRIAVISKSRDMDAYRIICVGESTTAGYPVCGLGYPEQLDSLLKKRNPGKRFQVFNFGVCAVTSTEIAKHFYRNIITYRPNLAIILVGNNNNCPRLSPQFEETSFFQILNRLKVYRVILFSYHVISGLLNKTVNIQRIYSDIYLTYDGIKNYPYLFKNELTNNLNCMLTTAAKNRCKVIICNYFISGSNEFLRAFAEKMSIPFCDNEKSYLSEIHSDWISEDGWHPSLKGYSVITQNLYNTIEKYNLINFTGDK